jgi:transaldolase
MELTRSDRGSRSWNQSPKEANKVEKDYFHRVTAQTPTRFWINNPTRAEVEKAIAAGAVGCTNNPAYCGKMVDREQERELVLALLDQALSETDDDSEAESLLQLRLTKNTQQKFLGIYKQTSGEHGYVSIQGDPIEEHDSDIIIREGRRNRQLGPNMCIKIPTTEAGLQAMEVLVAENTPINATECFAVKQAVDVCELYDRVTSKTGKYPKLYLSHIAGIYDEYLRVYVEREGVDISADVLCQAGLAVSRKVYRIMQERGYKATLVAGGARGLHHFTEMVGGDVCVTINWRGTADRLLEADPPVVCRLFNPVPQIVIHELMDKLPDFARGYADDGLNVEEYEEFGPVEHFRSAFVRSWNKILGIAAERRSA